MLPPCARRWLGCTPGEVERGTLAPRGPVQARAYLQEDPGIAAPIHARITALPVTVRAEFDQPVDRDSFGLTLLGTRCDYAPGPIDQETRWLSDRAAAITVRALPAGKPGPYALTLGHGKDQAGLAVVDLGTGATRTLRDVLAYQPGLEGWELLVLLWTTVAKGGKLGNGAGGVCHATPCCRLQQPQLATPKAPEPRADARFADSRASRGRRPGH